MGEELFSPGCSHPETVRTRVCIIDRRLYLTACYLSCLLLYRSMLCAYRFMSVHLSVLLRDRLKETTTINQTFKTLNKPP